MKDENSHIENKEAAKKKLQVEEVFSIEREVHADDKSESYWKIVKKQFKKNKVAMWGIRIITFIIFVAVLADFLANNKPIACEYQGEVYFPVFKEYGVDMGITQWQSQFLNVDWKSLKFDWAVWPPVPYLPGDIDLLNPNFTSPSANQDVQSTLWHHWLGTDDLGHDVLAGMIHGSRIALLVGVISMGIASIVGLILGALAGYFGDERLKMSIVSIICNILAIFFGCFYGFGARSDAWGAAAQSSFLLLFAQIILSIIIILVIFFIFNMIAKALRNVPILRIKVKMPVDILISRFIEVILCIPGLYLIISIAAVAKPSIFMVMVIIGLTAWTSIARFIRGEILRIRSLEYIEAARSLGFSELRIIFKHAIPNGLAPVLISIAFGIAGSILTVATLSFLGVGVPAETITWGSMLNLSRQATDAWWMSVIPGFAIFITVLIFNLAGEGLSDAMDPKQKH